MKKILLNFILIIAIIGIILALPAFVIFRKYKTTNTFGITEEFKIDKVIYYSSANAISNTTSFQNPEWNLKVYQYTDIAIYLKRINFFNELKYQNYITELVLENFAPNLEKAKIYYLNPKDFGNSELNLDELVENKLEYTVINSENQEDTQNYNIPVFFQDCSNPITFRIVTELSNNYQVSNAQTLTYNGSLIEELGLKTGDLNQNVTFDLVLKTKGAIHPKTIELKIPYENEEKSIVDDDIMVEKKENILF